MITNEYETLVQALLRSTDYGVLVTDLNGVDIFCNPRFGTLFGLEPDQILNLPRGKARKLAIARVQFPNDFIDPMERAYADPLMEFQDEVFLKRPKESVLRRHSAPILNTAKEVIGRVWTFLDVTETRTLQAEAAQYARTLEDKLGQQALELKLAQKRILEAAQMRAVGTVAVGIAHDLRNILTTLRLEMANSDNAINSTQVAQQFDRLYALTHTLLALSDEAHAHAGQIDVAEIIEFVFSLVKGQAEIDGVRLEMKKSQRVHPAYGNARRLEHLFVNLLLNGLNAVGPTGGTITVTLTQSDQSVRIDVQDTGPGIPSQNQDRLFEPFFTTRANKIGLGLFSARKIVEAHCGEIRIASEPGMGANVTVWLPTDEFTPVLSETYELLERHPKEIR